MQSFVSQSSKYNWLITNPKGVIFFWADYFSTISKVLWFEKFQPSISLDFSLKHILYSKYKDGGSLVQKSIIWGTVEVENLGPHLYQQFLLQSCWKKMILLTLGRHNCYLVMTVVNFVHTHENHKETRDYNSQRQWNFVFYLNNCLNSFAFNLNYFLDNWLS